MKTGPWTAERPNVRIEIVSDLSDAMRSDEGFIRVRRLVLRNHYDNGQQSLEYRYDCVERDAMDAVGIVLVDSTMGTPRVCLRSSIRPPLALRTGYALPIPDPSGDPTLYEIPAGLVEPDEVGEAGLRECAARETMEEVGLEVPADAFRTLGPAVALSPGLVAEKIHLFFADVQADKMLKPTMDGSPVEEVARIAFVPLAEALSACADGRITDIKTELGLRRLADHLGRA